MCLYAMENIDLKSSLGFLSLLMDRITDRFKSNILTGEKHQLHFHIKLELFDSEAIIHDTELPEQFHRLMAKDVYFEEKVYFDEEELADKNEFIVFTRELKEKLSDVVPYGYVCEDFLTQLINSEFETKNSYRLRPSRKINIQKLEYWLTPNEAVSNYIRD
jgi:hypothetical protein